MIAIDPQRFPGNGDDQREARAEALFDAIVGQGARLPSQRRYTARLRTKQTGSVTIPKALHDDLLRLSGGTAEG
ncbi:hypothetical protein PSQ90_07175 [Devosia rhodophyticola]|uniref:Uncharacterized protein n=1 Tax=Devosia rhodophyticola TaxID=3026423 RepID=A0ABY7Z0T5_9HYPH|nr:hypothetical protein [Devosia rhodophyticola]WDR07199.1 hypothetical protein PSQ90_07175 [Devosia rhodophyticola]